MKLVYLIVFGIIVLLFLTGVSFIVFAYVNFNILECIPHVPDSVAYIFQAKIFAEGKLFALTPPFPEHFDGINKGFLIMNEGKWFSQYPFGHPFMLMFGYLLGQPWLIPSLLGSISLLLMYLIGTEIHSRRLGFLTALLAFSSPFYQMNAVNFMSHNTALFFLVLFLFCFIKTVLNAHWSYALVSGISFGFLFNTRPLTAVAIAFPFVCFVIAELISSLGRIKQKIFPYLLMLLGFLILFLTFLIYNYILSGNAFLSPYEIGGATTVNLGFSNLRTFSSALMDFYNNLLFLIIVLYGWDNRVTFLFILFCIMLLPKGKWLSLFRLSALSISTFQLLFKGIGVMYGPRYWYEMIPFLVLLTSLGIEAIVEFCAGIISKIKKNLTKNFFIAIKSFLLIISYAFVFFLIINNLWFWFSSKQVRWKLPFTPANVYQLNGFNYANRDLIDLIEQNNIHNAVIFINPNDKHWWHYGIPFSQMSPFLQGDIIYVLDLGDEKNKRIVEWYSGRSYYKADYYTLEVVPYNI